MRLAVLAWVALAGLFAGCAGSSQPGSSSGGFLPTSDQIWLVELMSQRLQLAPAVAWTKYQAGSPVLDPEREAEVLANVVILGASLGLPQNQSEPFFIAQMEASRAVQTFYFNRWDRGKNLPQAPPVSLAWVIRPQIDVINAGMVTTLVRLAGKANEPGFARYAEKKLRERRFPREAVTAAVRPLRQP